jgi:hypothetical protein
VNGGAASAPLWLLQIDTEVASGATAGLDASAGAGAVTHKVGLAEARRALTLHRYAVIVLDPGAAGEAASMVLLDTLPAKNQTTPVLLYCDDLPSEACRDRANLALLKKSTAAPALWAMIRALAGSAPMAAPWRTA